jgi:membrane protein YdbS with pleckstrin-like domain
VLVRYGWILRRTRTIEIPLNRVESVQVERGLLKRRVTVAGTGSSSFGIEGVRDPEQVRDAILDAMRRFA